MTTRTCSQCSQRYVGPDDKPFRCPNCQTENPPPAREPNEIRDKVTGSLSQFFKSVTASSLLDHAEHGSSLVDSLFTQEAHRMHIWTARGYLGRRGLDYLKELTDDEIDAMVDQMMDGPASDHAYVLWQYPEWSRAQIYRARDILLNA